MMRALKEYNEMVMRPSWKWLRRHWKGYSVLTAISSSLKTESEETKMTAIYSKQTGNFRITLNRKEAEALGYTSTSYDTLLTALQMWPDADCFHIYGSKAQVAADLTTAMARA